MEYYLCRAMEVCKLTEGQLAALHEYEELKGRCLFPYEIQGKFNVPTSAQFYELSSDPGEQSSHNQNLRNQFRQHGLFVNGEDLSATVVKPVHDFDRVVRNLHQKLAIDFTYRGAKSSRKRVLDNFE